MLIDFLLPLKEPLALKAAWQCGSQLAIDSNVVHLTLAKYLWLHLRTHKSDVYTEIHSATYALGDLICRMQETRCYMNSKDDLKH